MSTRNRRVRGAEQTRGQRVQSAISRAERHLRCAFAVGGTLLPWRAACRVAHALARPDAVRFVSALERAGCLRESARVTLDAPAKLRAAVPASARPLLPLALFGLPGQGHGTPRENRHREFLFQQFCADLVREARDPQALQAAALRVLHASDVQRDPELSSMLRLQIAQLECDLRARIAQQRAELDQITGRPTSPAPPTNPFERKRLSVMTAAQIKTTYERLGHELHDYLVHYDLTSAYSALNRLTTLQQTYPDAIPAAYVERVRLDVQRVEQRAAEIRQQIQQLAAGAVAAAERGEHDVVVTALKRLSSLHNSRPNLLGDLEFRRFRDAIQHASDEADHRRAAEELLARERAVAAELRTLLGFVRRFHETSRTTPHNDPRYLAAAAEYRRAVESIRSHDGEWLADLMLELDEMLEDLHDPTGRADQQVSRFIETVRTALRSMRLEVRQIATEKGPPQGGSPADSAAS